MYVLPVHLNYVSFIRPELKILSQLIKESNDFFQKGLKKILPSILFYTLSMSFHVIVLPMMHDQATKRLLETLLTKTSTNKVFFPFLKSFL